jgi:hypothetical protein
MVRSVRLYNDCSSSDVRVDMRGRVLADDDKSDRFRKQLVKLPALGWVAIATRSSACWRCAEWLHAMGRAAVATGPGGYRWSSGYWRWAGWLSPLGRAAIGAGPSGYRHWAGWISPLGRAAVGAGPSGYLHWVERLSLLGRVAIATRSSGCWRLAEWLPSLGRVDSAPYLLRPNKPRMYVNLRLNFIEDDCLLECSVADSDRHV